MNSVYPKVKIPRRLLELLKDPAAVKSVGTLSTDGSPYVTINSSLTSLDGKSLIISEDLEKSVSNVNLVQSIWFNKPAAVCVFKGDISFEIKVRVHRCLIVGKTFEQMLGRKRAVYGNDADISVVWELHPQEITEISPGYLRKKQLEKHPYFDCHLDRSGIKA